jgi:hypothetical protein
MIIYIRQAGNYKSVHALKNIKGGTRVLDLSGGDRVWKPTRTSVQLHSYSTWQGDQAIQLESVYGHDVHIEHEVGGCINHSCQPTCEIRSQFLVALADIEEGDEITFDYNKNEKRLASPFECRCCGKMIRGSDYE